ncbi:peptide chain release factor N(5)-glutamine methyltransferase [Halocola ammonii]
MNTKLPDNSLGTLAKYFRESLKNLYVDREVQQITALVFSELLGFSRADLTVKADERLSESDILKVHFALKKLLKLEPVQYVLGVTDFMDLKIKVNRDVLIPRPETEELVHWIGASLKDQSPVILDVGTGSGCIALGLKRLIPKAKVYGADISEEALKVARENAAANELEVEFVLQDALKTADIGQPVDVIVSNPPYIPLRDKEEMSTLVYDNEPNVALFVDDQDELIFYYRIVNHALVNLKPGGMLFFEIHESNDKAVESIMQSAGFENVELKLDMQEKPRMIMGVKPV